MNWMNILRRVRLEFAVEFHKLDQKIKYYRIRSNLRLSHITAYSVGNAGDTVLSECVRKTFNGAFGLVSWKLFSLYRKVDVSLIRAFNRTDALVIGGGGLFLPDTNANGISGWQWACSKENLRKIEIPIILYSVGYNYFRGQSPEPIFIDNLNVLVEKCVFFGLRNMGSVRMVQELVNSELRGKVCYQPCTTTLIRILCPKLPEKKRSGKVAFNFAFDRSERRFGGNREEILKQLVESVYRIRNKGYEIYIVAHCLNDLNILEDIHERSQIHAVNACSWELGKLADFYNDMDVVLGMRGHAQMIPFGVNCQIITLGSHEKMKWFLQDINAMDWYIELTENIGSLSDRIVQKFIEIHEINGEKTDLRLREAQKQLWKITQDNMGRIVNDLTITGKK